VIVLETERLDLRQLVVEDAAFILELLNEPAFIQNIGDRGVRTLDDARSYISDGPISSYERHGFGLYRVDLRQSGEAIGICGLLKRDTLANVDIGFALLERFRSKGYATEAASAVRTFAQEVVGLDRLVAVVARDNQASIRVLEKIGLEFENLVRLADDEPVLKLYGCNF